MLGTSVIGGWLSAEPLVGLKHRGPGDRAMYRDPFSRTPRGFEANYQPLTHAGA